MKKASKFISLVLALSMVFTAVPLNALDFENSPEIIVDQTTEENIEDSLINESDELTEEGPVIIPSDENSEEETSIINDSSKEDEKTENNQDSVKEDANNPENITQNTPVQDNLNEKEPINSDSSSVTIDELQNEGWAFEAVLQQGETTNNNMTWNSTVPEKQTYTYELRYSRPSISDEDTTTIYQPGDVQIEVGSMFKDVVRKLNNYLPSGSFSWTCSVGEVETEDSDWVLDVTRDSSILGLPTNFIFSNTKQINPTQALSGSIQITFTLNSDYMQTPATISNSATLTTTSGASITSNPMTLNFTSTRAPYSLNVSTSKVSVTPSTSLPEDKDSYYWAKYVVYYSVDNAAGVRESFGKNLQIEALPGIKVFDSTMQEISQTNGNYLVKESYPEKLSSSGTGKEHYGLQEDQTAVFYVAFPTNTYGSGTTNVTLKLNGTPVFETEEVNIATKTESIIPSDFKLNYIGYVFIIGKGKESNQASYEDISRKGTLVKGVFIWGYYYDPKIGAVDMDCIQDVVFAPDKNGGYYHMDDSEYEYTGFYYKYENTSELIYGMHDPVTGEDLTGKFETEVWVRYSGESDYVMIDSGYDILQQDTKYTFEDKIPAGKTVAAYKIKVLNVNRDFKLSLNSYIKVHTDKVADRGAIYFFNLLRPYLSSNGNEVELNITENNYSGFNAKEELKAYDMSTYGKYVFRSSVFMNINQSQLPFQLDINVSGMANSPSKEYISFNYVLDFLARQRWQYNSPSSFEGMVMYDLLPDGVQLLSTEEEIKESILVSNLVTYENEEFGADLTKNKNILKYLTVEIIENYHNSGRTMVKLILDTSAPEAQIDTTKYMENGTQSNGGVVYTRSFLYGITLKCKMNYDAIQEYGTTLTNSFYVSDINNTDKGYSLFVCTGNAGYPPVANAQDDGQNDPDVKDIDDDGNITESLHYATLVTTNDIAIGTYTDFVKQVSPDQVNYVTGLTNVNNGATYSYKLRARTGVNKAKDLVFFDSLENAGKGWKGTFAGFDTSYIESKGYKAVIYYANTYNYSKDLSNPMWQLYTSSVPAANVKSIAVTFTMADGSQIIYPENSLMYIKVLMTSPSDPNIKTFAKNDAYCEWTPVDSALGTDLPEITFESNVVTVALPNSVEGDEGPFVSIDFTKELEGTDAAFENMNLDKNGTFLFKITLTKQEANEDGSFTVVNGLLTNKTHLLFTGLTPGNWKVEETDDNYFNFVEFIATIPEGTTGITFNPQTNILTISDEIESDQYLSILCKNRIENNRPYEEEDKAENLFKATAPSPQHSGGTNASN